MCSVCRESFLEEHMYCQEWRKIILDIRNAVRSNIASDAIVVNFFIINHSMRLAMFNEFKSLILLYVAETHFAFVIIMLKRFQLIIDGLQGVVVSDKWANYREVTWQVQGI